MLQGAAELTVVSACQAVQGLATARLLSSDGLRKSCACESQGQEGMLQQ